MPDKGLHFQQSEKLVAEDKEFIFLEILVSTILTDLTYKIN